MELIGKGPDKKGAVWVARRIPDGYISGHANHARITSFPLADGEKSINSRQLDKIFDKDIETVYAWDVIDLARECGWYKGKIRISVSVTFMLLLISVQPGFVKPGYGPDSIR